MGHSKRSWGCPSKERLPGEGGCSNWGGASPCDGEDTTVRKSTGKAAPICYVLVLSWIPLLKKQSQAGHGVPEDKTSWGVQGISLSTQHGYNKQKHNLQKQSDWNKGGRRGKRAIASGNREAHEKLRVTRHSPLLLRTARLLPDKHTDKHT